MSSFDVSKEKVKSIISKSNNEVTNKTNYKTGGIYMLYVDCFDDDKIIPFYIGETSDFQRRHKEHMTQVMSLNRLSYKHYKFYLLNNFYINNYKACKIFSYMVNHNCTLKDIHMIILDEFDEAYEKIIERRQLEYKYINELNSQYYGFNQLPCISNSFIGEQDNSQIEKEIFELLGNVEYGFGWFNLFVDYYYVIKYINVQKVSNIMIKAKLNNIQRIQEIKEEFKGLNKELDNIRYDFTILCENDILKYFSENKLKRDEKKGLLYDILLFDKDDKEFREYVKRYAKGNGEDIINQLKDKYNKELMDMKKRLDLYDKNTSILQDEYSTLLESLFSQLIPINSYATHPLKDGYSDYIFNNINEDVNDALYINIEYSCFRSDDRYDIYPEILKINYLFIKDGLRINKEKYIKTGLEMMCTQNPGHVKI